MKKLTAELKSKYSKDSKGKTYLFLIEANRIAFENLYEGFTIDTGIKQIENFVNSKIDTIYADGGPFWSNDFRGFDEIYSKAKLAVNSIVENEYNQSIIDFVQSAIKSYIPAIDELRLKGQSSVIPIKHTEDETITFLKLGETGAQKIAREEREANEEIRLEEERTNRGSLLDMAVSLDDEDEDEDEDIEVEESNIKREDLGGLSNGL